MAHIETVDEQNNARVMIKEINMEQTRMEEKVEKIVSNLPSDFFQLTEEQQELRVAIYRHLAQGKPVSINDLASSLSIPLKKVEEMLQSTKNVSYDTDGKIEEYAGLSPVRRTPHQLIIEGKTIYNWCALDTLVFGLLIQKPAKIKSKSPVTDKIIEFRISPEKIENLRPKEAVMSLETSEPDKTTEENVRTTFCCHVNFFSDNKVGEEWAQEQSGSFTFLSLEEAFLLGKSLNMKMFPKVLA